VENGKYIMFYIILIYLDTIHLINLLDTGALHDYIYNTIMSSIRKNKDLLLLPIMIGIFIKPRKTDSDEKQWKRQISVPCKKSSNIQQQKVYHL
jgi:hypothetical protein